MKSQGAQAPTLFTRDGFRKYLTSDEVRRFLQQAETQDAHVNLLCQVLTFTGCRLSEALNLTDAAIDLDNQAITFRTLKQRRSGVFRQVPVPVTLLKNLLEFARPGERIWPVHRQTGRRWVTEVMHQAGISRGLATSRSLRHGFAVGAIEENVPVTLLQRWMGHTRLETTAIYLQAVGPQERQFAARRWASLAGTLAAASHQMAECNKSTVAQSTS